ncbi:MAG: sulfurtransferase [Gammaproteobacteria bacterium]|nr:sulfurtransferase [Gammaproteobacteria bacterium]
MVREIDSVTLQQRLGSEDEPILLDIRGANELVQGILPDSKHLPMHVLPLRISEFPKDRDIVLYCHSGARSHTACHYLAQQGHTNVINLRGGIISWAQSGLQIVQPSMASNG